jgi:hypothetical protein
MDFSFADIVLTGQFIERLEGGIILYALCTTSRLSVGWCMNDELERIWKEEVIV